MTRLRLTTGWIPVPAAPPGVARTLQVLLSNTGRTAAPAAVQVNRLENDGTKGLVRAEHVIVPVGEAVRLLVDDAAGQILEVALELPSEHVRPSAGVVTGGGSADAADLSAWLGPGAFTELAPGVGGRRRGAVRRTTGMLPVDVLEGAFSPDFIYRFEIFVSNFNEAPSDVPYTISVAREPLAAKAVRDEGVLAVGGHGGVRYAAEGVGGRTVEATLALPGPGLVPSAAVVRENPQDGSGDLLWIVTGARMARLPSAAAAPAAGRQRA